jgi:integrase
MSIAPASVVASVYAELYGRDGSSTRTERCVKEVTSICGPVENLTHVSILHYLATLKKQGLSNKTLNNRLWMLSAYCAELARAGIIAGNPCQHVRPLEVERLPPRWLRPAQYRAFLAEAVKKNFFNEVMVALATGLRLEELCRLAWIDVDWHRKKLMVRKSKAGKFRCVDLNKRAMATLRMQAKQTAHLHYIFPARQTYTGGWRWKDKARCKSSMLRAFDAVRDASIPEVLEGMGPRSTGRAWHLLRHTFCSRLVQRGVSLRKIANWAGHADTRITEKLYAHLAEEWDPDIERA